jgi:outer membrane protein OmpA-like peptidoglycan-associated protein
MTAVPPPPPPPVAAAPRAPVTAKPLAKKKPATTKAKSPRTQVASIPRLGAITSGSKLQVLFAPASARLESDAKTVLGPVSAALAKNSKLRVELKAYARGNAETVSQARRLSLSRALAIRSHLIKGGVRATRIDVRALGNKVPNGVPNRVDLLVFTR